ncbi:hypothetical protein ACFLZS_01550 [Patescibacteria group bacterium]
MSQLGTMLPQKADMATINFTDADRNPVRNQEEIILPFHPEAEFYPLQEGRQFLYRTSGGNVWFGGTDEQPFLTELIPKTLQVFKKHGEGEFYEYLKPYSIQQLEKILGIPSKRQGDIFAIPLERTWSEIKKELAILTGEEIEQELVKDYPVLGTRHQLAEAFVISTPRLFAEGGMEAPDHESLILKGPHILDQVDVLRDPRNAD